MLAASDTLRVNDERVLGLTGAQFMSLLLVPTSVWIWLRVRKLLVADVAAGVPVGLGVAPAASAPHVAAAPGATPVGGVAGPEEGTNSDISEAPEASSADAG